MFIYFKQYWIPSRRQTYLMHQWAVLCKGVEKISGGVCHFIPQAGGTKKCHGQPGCLRPPRHMFRCRGRILKFTCDVSLSKTSGCSVHFHQFSFPLSGFYRRWPENVYRHIPWSLPFLWPYHKMNRKSVQGIQDIGSD
jgi:hypothetical protein